MPDRKLLQCATQVDFSLDAVFVRFSVIHLIFVYSFSVLYCISLSVYPVFKFIPVLIVIESYYFGLVSQNILFLISSFTLPPTLTSLPSRRTPWLEFSTDQFSVCDEGLLGDALPVLSSTHGWGQGDSGERSIQDALRCARLGGS